MAYEEPDFMPWDGRRVPLTLLGGYLGAGKTTLINELLARTTRPIAVLVNDVGEVNVDAALIKRRSGDTIEFTDGCVCCSLSDGLGEAFDQLRARSTPPEHVILELSGLADPARVAPWGRSAGFVLDGIVIVVDGEQVVEQLAQDVVGLGVATQIEAADLIIVSKTDLLGDSAAVSSKMEELRRVTGQLAPGTPTVSLGSAGAGAALLELGRRDVELAIPEQTLFDAHRVETMPFPTVRTEAELADWLDELRPDVVRAKGIVELEDQRQLVVQVVGRRRSMEPVLQSERGGPTDLVVISVTATPS